MRTIGNKGQGTFLSGDIPSIIMIVVSISFFLSSIYLSNEEFQSKKADIDMQAALVDAASTFLKENAKIKASDLSVTSQFWAEKIDKIKRTHGVEVYVDLTCVPGITESPCGQPYTYGKPPASNIKQLSKRFPIALRGDTELDVFPALIKVYVFRA